MHLLKGKYFTYLICICILSPILKAQTPENQSENANKKLKKLVCTSNDKIEGWTGVPTYDYVIFTAFLEDSRTLKSARIDGAFISDVRDLQSEDNSEQNSRSTFGPLEDPWCWFHILLPKVHLETESPIFGDNYDKPYYENPTIQYICEWNSSKIYINNMICTLTR